MFVFKILKKTLNYTWYTKIIAKIIV